MSALEFTPEEIEREEWRDVPGYEGYQASTLGRVRSRWRPGPQVGLLNHEWKVLSPSTDKDGYPILVIRGRRKLVHHMILEAFVGPRVGEGCHADDVRINNRITNLSWGTHAKNYADRVRNGGGNQGERHGMSKLTDADVIEARRLYRERMGSCTDLAKRFGVSQSQMSEAVSGRSFAHLPGHVLPREGKTRLALHTGGNNKTSKLTDDQAREIRRLYAEGERTLISLATAYSVSKKSILNIVQRKTYPDA